MKRVFILLTLAALALRTFGDAAGCLFVPASTNEPMIILPLKKTDVSMDVTAGIAQTEVVQRFHNDLERPLEAVYLFPLPANATVTGFEIRMKDRVIRSEVREREEAKAAYEQAKTEGKKAALLEQERPNLFTTSIANLLPGETVDICLTYSEPLQFKSGRYDLAFPMVTGERYIPENPLTREPRVPDADRLNPPVLPPAIDPEHRLSITVRLRGLPVKSITSNTHAIDVHPDGNDRFTVTLARKLTLPDSVFSLAVHLRESETPAISFIRSPAGDGETYGLLSVFPPTGGNAATYKPPPKDVIFLIDTSGSMSGESIAQARSGLKRCLDILNPDDRFTIVRFASEFSWFSPELRSATPEKLADAKDYIAGLEAGGGTEMQPALEYALNTLPKTAGRMPMIIFLTDGDVGNEDSLSALLLSRLGNTRVFTFGIGSAPNEFLMNRMAEIGRGQSRFIHSHEDIGEVTADFFQTLENPVLTDVSVRWDDPAVHVYPERCPDVYCERPLRLVARSAGGFGGKLRITGTLAGEQVEYIVDLNEQNDTEHPAINRLYGQMEINDLMLQMLQAGTPERRDEIRQEIIRTALNYQLVSRYTSRVAIEERVVVENGDLVSVKVPVPAPKGWTLYSTATSDPLRLLTGFAALLAAAVLRRITHAPHA
jgi:Ca-activated chloride channel family protein